jgi:hypothetical protein
VSEFQLSAHLDRGTHHIDTKFLSGGIRRNEGLFRTLDPEVPLLSRASGISFEFHPRDISFSLANTYQVLSSASVMISPEPRCASHSEYQTD